MEVRLGIMIGRPSESWKMRRAWISITSYNDSEEISVYWEEINSAKHSWKEYCSIILEMIWSAPNCFWRNFATSKVRKSERGFRENWILYWSGVPCQSTVPEEKRRSFVEQKWYLSSLSASRQHEVLKVPKIYRVQSMINASPESPYPSSEPASSLPKEDALTKPGSLTWHIHNMILSSFFVKESKSPTSWWMNQPYQSRVGWRGIRQDGTSRRDWFGWERSSDGNISEEKRVKSISRSSTRHVSTEWIPPVAERSRR